MNTGMCLMESASYEAEHLYSPKHNFHIIGTCRVNLAVKEKKHIHQTELNNLYRDIQMNTSYRDPHGFITI